MVKARRMERLVINLESLLLHGDEDFREQIRVREERGKSTPMFWWVFREKKNLWIAAIQFLDKNKRNKKYSFYFIKVLLGL
jgi:hypothetical protein